MKDENRTVTRHQIVKENLLDFLIQYCCILNLTLGLYMNNYVLQMVI